MKFKYYYQEKTYLNPWELASAIAKRDRNKAIKAINDYANDYPDGDFQSVDDDISTLDLKRILISILCLEEYCLSVQFALDLGADPDTY